MRVVLDTNVIISALLFRGRPEQLLLRCLQPDIALITSVHILEEVQRVLERKSNWDIETITGSIKRLYVACEIVASAIRVSECRDPDDDRILEAALAGEADLIVTGDADLLSMRAFRGVEILSVSSLLERLTPGETT